MPLSYRIAFFCGALPLCSGVSVFALWCLTRWDWLVLAGFWVIGVGLIFVMVGLTALLRFWTLSGKAASHSQSHNRWATAICLATLLSNFPAAIAIVVAVSLILRMSTVFVRNETAHTVNQVRVFGGGVDEWIGAVRPGEVAEESFWIWEEGVLELSIQRAGVTENEVLIEQVDEISAARTTVTIHSDGSISADSKFPHWRD